MRLKNIFIQLLFYTLFLFSTQVPANLKKTDSLDGYLPMFFNPQDNGVRLSEPHFEYDLSGDEYQIGGLKFSIEDFGIYSGLIAWVDTQGTYYYKDRVEFQLPKGAMHFGKVEVYSRIGRKLLELNFDEKNMQEWKTWKKKLSTGKRVTKGNRYLKILKDPNIPSEIPFGSVEIEQGLFTDVEEPIFYCVSAVNVQLKLKSKICSPPLKKRGGQFLPFPYRTTKTFVKLDGKNRSKGKILLKQGEEPRKLRARLKDGIRLRVDFAYPRYEIVDIIATAGSEVRLIGIGERPLGYEYLDEVPFSLWKLFYLEETYPNKPRYWQVFIENGGAIYISMLGLDLKTIKISSETYPVEEQRPYLKLLKSEETYSSRPKLEGVSEVGVSGFQQSELKNLEGNKIELTFPAPKKSEINLGKVRVEKKFVASRGIYRGYSNLLSGVGTLAPDLNNGQLVVLYNFHSEMWFNSIFGWRNRWLSYQKWGVDLKYVGSFTNPQTIGFNSLEFFETSLKYRFYSGLAYREATVGAIYKYFSADLSPGYEGFHGLGMFWSRSLFKILSDSISWIGIFDHPIWLDMHFVYFPVDGSGRIPHGLNFQTSFEAKVFWRPWFFGRFGLDYRNIEFQISSNQKASLGLVGGSLGFGILF